MDDDTFGARTGFLLSRVGLATTMLFRETLAPLGLKPPHWAVLNVVDAGPPLSQQALGEVVRIDPSSMVSVLDELESGGLIERVREPTDRRRYTIKLTPKGRRKLAQARTAADGHEERVLAPLSDAERTRLHALLLRLATAGHLPDTPHPPITQPRGPSPK
jgi:DNA-binding MarR family transcriptional regulator